MDKKSGAFGWFKNKNLIIIGLIFLLILVLGSLIFLIFQKNDSRFSNGVDQEKIQELDLEVNYQLTAIEETAGLLSPKAHFIFSSKQALESKQVEDLLKFEPTLDFEVKENADLISWIKSAWAAKSLINRKFANQYEIIPTQELAGGQLYKAQVFAGQLASRDYSWAFQVEKPFQIERFFPAHQAVNVPINSGIEIEFTREEVLSPEDFFSIEPAVKGRFEKQGSTLVFLPEGLQERVVYRVGLKEGVKTKSGETLAEKISFSFETGTTAYGGTEPRLILNDFENFKNGDNPAFEVNYSNLDLIGTKASVYKFQKIEDFIDSYGQSRRWDLSWTRWYSSFVGKDFNPTQTQKVFDFEIGEIIETDRNKFFQLPQDLPDGFYVLDIQSDKIRKQSWFQISSLAQYHSFTYEDGFIWLQDLENQVQLDQAKATLVISNKTEALGDFNSEGLSRFKTPFVLKNGTELQEKEEASPKFLRIETSEGKQLASLIGKGADYYVNDSVSAGNYHWSYFGTDRNLYRSKDTVNYWGVIKGRIEDVRQKKVTIEVFDGYYNPYYSNEKKPIKSSQLMISSFGTIEGLFDLDGLNNGYYTINVLLEGKIVASSSFRVDTFVKPAYRINVSSDKKAIFAGETVKFQVNTEFYEGTPVPNLALKYEGYYMGNFIKGEFTVDENGRAEVVLPTEYIQHKHSYPTSLNLTFSPVNPEEAEITNRTYLQVFGPNVYLQAKAKKNDEGLATVSVKLNEIVLDKLNDGESETVYYGREYIGNPLPNQLINAELTKISYDREETGNYYDPINKITRETYRYIRKEEVVETFKGISDEKGQWDFEKQLPVEEQVFYQFKFLGSDNQGRFFNLTTSIVDSRYIDSLSRSFELRSLDKDFDYYGEYKEGEAINLNLALSRDSQSVLNTLFFKYQRAVQQVWTNQKLELKDKFVSASIPAVAYRGVVFTQDGFFETNTFTASFAEEEKNLNIDIEPNQQVYRPGDRVDLDLFVGDISNKPVPDTAVNISVVDEALFDVYGYGGQDMNILKQLYDDNIFPLVTGLVEYAQSDMGAERGGCFVKGTTVLTSNHQAVAIEDLEVGDVVLTFDDKQKTLKTAVIQGTSSHLVNEYLVFNKKLRVTANHRVFSGGDWKQAGQLKKGDWFLRSSGDKEEIYSIEKVYQPGVEVFNLVVGDYHTYFAGGFYVHNEEKGGGVREDFQDAPYFGSLVTDKAGKGSASFELPDNLTSWQVLAKAFDYKQIRAGQVVENLPVSLPFFVEGTLSEQYLLGDNPVLRLRIFGDQLSDELVEYWVQSETLGIEKIITTNEKEVFIDLGSLKSEGQHKILIGARQKGLEDQMIKEIEVLKSYFKIDKHSEQVLKSGVQGLKGAPNAYTKVIIVDQGKGYYYPELRRLNYSPGSRLDQLLTRTLSGNYLEKYFAESFADNLDLSSYLSNGALKVFPYDQTDLTLTVKVADLYGEFLPKVAMVKYLESQTSSSEASLDDVAKALYGLASLGESVLDKVHALSSRDDLSFEGQLYLALASCKLGDLERARSFFQEKIVNKLVAKEGLIYLNSKFDPYGKNNPLVAVIVSYLNLENAINFWDYLKNEKNNPTDNLDLLEQMIFLRNQLDRFENSNYQASFNYQLAGKQEQVQLKKGKVISLFLSPKELDDIKFEEVNGQLMAVSYYREGEDHQLIETSPHFTIKRFLTDKNGKNRVNNEFSLGELVKVKLKVSFGQEDLKGYYNITDFLPSGLRPIIKVGYQSNDNLCLINRPAGSNGNEVYFGVFGGSQCLNYQIEYLARVVSPGEYQINPAVIQKSSTPSSLNLSQLQKIIIKQ